jgi:hypothetical protein
MSELSINTTRELLAYIKENLSNDKNLSIRGLERLCGIGRTALIKGGDFRSEKLGQTLIEHGFTAGDLVKNGFDAKACWLVIEYYAYESKAKAPGAKRYARVFGQLGIMNTFDELNKVPTPNGLELTQTILNDIYAAIRVKCEDVQDADDIMRQVVEYLNLLNPKDKSTVKMALIAAHNRLECADDRGLEKNQCVRAIVKQLRQIQVIMEGAKDIPLYLFPKIEQADPENAHILNPSSVQHLLPSATTFKIVKHKKINQINVRELTIPSRNGNIKQYVPQLTAGFTIDLPGVYIEG